MYYIRMFNENISVVNVNLTAINDKLQIFFWKNKKLS